MAAVSLWPSKQQRQSPILTFLLNWFKLLAEHSKAASNLGVKRINTVAFA